MSGSRRLAPLAQALSARAAATAASGDNMREAAVAVIVRDVADPELLLIKRAERAGDPWSGHIAFPGGTRSPADADLLATAYRESLEETGIPLGQVGRLLGALDVVAPSTPRLPPIRIAPFVVAVPHATQATPDRLEVVDTFWVPFSHLRDERNAREFLLEIESTRRSFPSVQWNDHVIWGLTHRILTQFLEIAREAGL